MNENYIFTEANCKGYTMSDACEGYGSNKTRHEHGLGVYVHKFVETKVTTLYNINGVEMRETVGGKVKYTIYMDGEEWMRYDDRQTAEECFVDFAGISKAKLRKLAKAAG